MQLRQTACPQEPAGQMKLAEQGAGVCWAMQATLSSSAAVELPAACFVLMPYMY